MGVNVTIDQSAEHSIPWSIKAEQLGKHGRSAFLRRKLSRRGTKEKDSLSLASCFHHRRDGIIYTVCVQTERGNLWGNI